MNAPERAEPQTPDQPADEVAWRVRDANGDDPDFRRLLEVLFGPEPVSGDEPAEGGAA